MKKHEKTIIFYDSLYGNTEKIARAIGEGLTGEVDVMRVGNAKVSELKTFDLLITGPPVHGGRATPNIDALFQQLPAHSLGGKRVAARASASTRLNSASLPLPKLAYIP